MGVAGAARPRRPGQFIVLAGIAGLLAGAFSMAAGEYISMQSQRELFERQIALERAEMEAMPEEEEAEMAALYRAKGFRDGRGEGDRPPPVRGSRSGPSTQLIREELGLDPDELGSPFGAAVGSFVAFAIGAFVPVVPVPARGRRVGAFVAAIVLSLAALFAVGAGGQPADGPRRPVLRASARSDRRGGGGRDVRGRQR